MLTLSSCRNDGMSSNLVALYVWQAQGRDEHNLESITASATTASAPASSSSTNSPLDCRPVPLPVVSAVMSPPRRYRSSPNTRRSRSASRFAIIFEGEEEDGWEAASARKPLSSFSSMDSTDCTSLASSVASSASDEGFFDRASAKVPEVRKLTVAPKSRQELLLSMAHATLCSWVLFASIALSRDSIAIKRASYGCKYCNIA